MDAGEVARLKAGVEALVGALYEVTTGDRHLYQQFAVRRATVRALPTQARPGP